MGKRLLDIVLALIGLVLAAPLLAVAAIGIRLSSRGPVLYRATLAGLHGHCFTMLKLRTMHIARELSASKITAQHDARVFAFGALLRRIKIDELPQLVNVLVGDMSIVGPRPEHPDLIREHYGMAHYATLSVRPGLTSPGTLYDYTHGESLIGHHEAERNYAERLLPIKLALDLVYVQHAPSLWYDIELVFRTLWLILATSLGRSDFNPPREFGEAIALLGAASKDEAVEYAVPASLRA